VSVPERGPLSLIEESTAIRSRKLECGYYWPLALVSAAAGADTAVARASVAIAAEPVGRSRFEWVVQLRLLGLCLLDHAMMAVDPLVGVLGRISRHRGRRYDAKRQRQA
jgi:hypothetical protein